jgi:polyisoprenoid-binding protein YceI
MQRTLSISITLGLLLCSAPVLAQSVVMQQSKIGFTFKQMNVPVNGQFKNFQAKIAFDPKKLTSTVAELSIPLNSVETGTADANTMLQNMDWFGVTKFPNARFVARKVSATAAGKFLILGDLSIKGKTQAVQSIASFKPSAPNSLTGVFEGSLSIPRLAFDIGIGEWKDEGMVANAVSIQYKLQLQ